MYSFVGRRSIRAETTAAAAAAAAHLRVTTYMSSWSNDVHVFLSHVRTRYFSEGFEQQHPPPLIKEASYTHTVLRYRYCTLL